MASRRSLGGGRVLGSGRNLSPAVSPAPSQVPNTQVPNAQRNHVRNASLLSPSESSLSLSSQTSNSPASTADVREDIGSKVPLGPSENAAARASNRLACPICNEEMVRKVLVYTMCSELMAAGDTPPAQPVRLSSAPSFTM